MIGHGLGYAVRAAKRAGLYAPAEIVFWRNISIGVGYFMLNLMANWRLLSPMRKSGSVC